MENVADILVGKTWRLHAQRKDPPASHSPDHVSTRERLPERPRKSWRQPRVLDKASGRWIYPEHVKEVERQEIEGAEGRGTGSRKQEAVEWNVYDAMASFGELDDMVIPTLQLIDLMSRSAIVLGTVGETSLQTV